jgi:dolichol-phosphate mannosyltransferase
MTARSTSFVSVVAIVDDDADRLPAFVAETLGVLAAITADHELILVDDGSGRRTVAACDRLLAEHECIRVIRLSRRFGADIAVTAGLDSAIGDLTVVMAVATDPPAWIPDFVAAGDQGADVVIGATGRSGRSWARRKAWQAFRRVFQRMTGSRLVPGAATMRLFSRRALNALTRIRQKTVHLRLLGCSVGFHTAVLDYEPVAPPRRTPLAATVAEAVSMLVTHSPAPLRLVSYLGGLASLLNVVCMAWVVVANVWKERVVEGWTTLSLQIAVMFFFLFTTLIVIAEYLAHAFEEVKDCPLYHVAEERCSSTAMSDARKRNIRMVSSETPEEKHGIESPRRVG